MRLTWLPAYLRDENVLVWLLWDVQGEVVMINHRDVMFKRKEEKFGSRVRQLLSTRGMTLRWKPDCVLALIYCRWPKESLVCSLPLWSGLSSIESLNALLSSARLVFSCHVWWQAGERRWPLWWDSLRITTLACCHRTLEVLLFWKCHNASLSKGSRLWLAELTSRCRCIYKELDKEGEEKRKRGRELFSQSTSVAIYSNTVPPWQMEWSSCSANTNRYYVLLPNHDIISPLRVVQVFSGSSENLQEIY